MCMVACITRVVSSRTEALKFLVASRLVRDLASLTAFRKRIAQCEDLSLSQVMVLALLWLVQAYVVRTLIVPMASAHQSRQRQSATNRDTTNGKYLTIKQMLFCKT